jgi:hypothetical protein
LFGNDVRDILDRDVAPSYPGVHLCDERPERARALDASPHGIVQLRLGGERLDQRVGLAGHQAVKVRHCLKLIPSPLVVKLRERAPGE